jgi:hypothetical protein
VITTELPYESYTEFAKQRREWHPLSREDFGEKIVKFGGISTYPGM